MTQQQENNRKLLHDRGICVIIPTYNNAGTIERVVRKTCEYCDDVIVVNDGSTDDTEKILKGIGNVEIVGYEKNKGKGYALKMGFRRARKMGFAYAITLDADGQHFSEDIPLFLQANQKHPGCLIVGSRNMEGVERSKGSIFANKFSDFWFWVQTGRWLSDTQTGYRLYPLKKHYGLPVLSNRYEAELQLMVFASWHGVKLEEIPVNVYYPPKEERVSHFRPGIDFARISLLNTVLCGLALIYGLPLRIFRFLMKWGRTLYAALFFGFFSVLLVTPMVWCYTKIGKMTEKKRMKVHRLVNWMARFLMLRHGIPGTSFSYQMPDDVDFDKPKLIIANHQSHLDLACQLIFTPKMIFLTNGWAWNNPLYRTIIHAAEFVPVTDSIDKIVPHLKSLVERGYSIAVYPEGTRSRDCRIGRFHQGPFFLADHLGLDILPMCMYGPGKVLPKGVHHLNKSPLYVEVGDVVSNEELKKLGTYREQASWFRKYFIQKYESIANQIEQDV